MLNSKHLVAKTTVILGLLISHPVWAGGPSMGLPGPGIVGLIAVAILGAIALSRPRK